MSSMQKNPTSVPGVGLNVNASATAPSRPNEAPMPHAATPAPRDTVSVPTFTVGGNGQDGTVSVLGADGHPVFQTVRGSVGINRVLKHIAARTGGGTVAGLLHLVNREGRQTAHCAMVAYKSFSF
jgi:hypothetical protein